MPDWRDLRESNDWGNMGTITCDQVLEQVSIVGAALQVKDAWALTYDPGNASRYDIWFVPIHGHPEPWILLCLENFQSCYRFNISTWLHPTYVAEKLNVGIPDGACIAELLMALGEVIGARTESV
jgi:hypothetical protein